MTSSKEIYQTHIALVIDYHHILSRNTNEEEPDKELRKIIQEYEEN